MTAGLTRLTRLTGWGAALAAGALVPGAAAGAQAAPHASLTGAVLRAQVSGVIRDRTGRAQVGVAVELLNARYAVVARTFTDDRGRYALPRLGAGLYQIKATSELLLPAIHPDVRLLADTRAIVNLTLASLYQALDWLPAEPRQAGSPADEWDWTLRLPTNRPLLRVLPPALARQAGVDGPVLVERAGGGTRSALRAAGGAGGFGDGGWTGQVTWRTTGEGGRALGLGAEAGPARFGGTVAYRQELTPDRAMTAVARYSERPAIRGSSGAGLAIARVRSESTWQAGDLLELRAGAELAAAQMGAGPLATASEPFASLCVHAGASEVMYRVATGPAPSVNDAEALVAENGRLRFTQGLHQELRATRRAGSWTGEIAGFEDRLEHPVVQGLAAGDAALVDSKDVLFDPQTGIIAVSGRGYSHGGVLALLRDQLSPDTWLSLRFALGEAVTAPEPGGTLPKFGTRTAPAATVAGETRLPAGHTLLRASYGWQPFDTLTPVAPFAGDGAARDAYLGLSVRQPLPLRFAGEEREGAGRLEAVLDVRNLLAQGYRPFLSEDGSTVFFAQAQRTIAGGISLSF